jgi:hypothetical protein
MVTVKYDDLSAAFDFVSFAAPFEHRAFVSLDTGAVYWISEMSPIDEEDLPDDLDTSDRYIAVPHKNELDLGNNLALRCVEANLPHRYADVERVFRRTVSVTSFDCFANSVETASGNRLSIRGLSRTAAHGAPSFERPPNRRLQPTAADPIKSRRS